jgi:phosphate/sulfate permease
MTSPRRPAPPPLEANDEVVTAVITAAWAVALVVLLIMRTQTASVRAWWIWTCVMGLAMGLFGLWYVPRYKRARAAAAQRRVQCSPERARRARRSATVLRLLERARRGRRRADAQGWSSDSNTVSSTDTPGRSTRS